MNDFRRAKIDALKFLVDFLRVDLDQLPENEWPDLCGRLRRFAYEAPWPSFITRPTQVTEQSAPAGVVSEHRFFFDQVQGNSTLRMTKEGVLAIQQAARRALGELAGLTPDSVVARQGSFSVLVEAQNDFKISLTGYVSLDNCFLRWPKGNRERPLPVSSGQWSPCVVTGDLESTFFVRVAELLSNKSPGLGKCIRCGSVFVIPTLKKKFFCSRKCGDLDKVQRYYKRHGRGRQHGNRKS